MINIHQTKKYNRLGGLDYPENQQENKSKLIRKEYPRIREYNREKDCEIYTFYRVDCRGRGWRGQQLPEFKKRSEAEDHARDVAKKVVSGEGNVSADTIRLVERLQAKLLPYGIPIDEAVDAFIEAHKRTIAIKSTETLFNVTDWYLAAKSNPNQQLRIDTVRGIKATCAKLRSCFGNVPIGSITSETVECALEGLNTKNTTKKDYLNRFRTFFKWCMAKRQGFITQNPCGSEKDGDAIKIKATDKADIMILSNDDVVTLLGKTLEYPELIPYISLCLFGGVRPEECKKMKWEHIWDDERETIYLPTSVTKTYERKTPLHPTLREWLVLRKGCPFKITNHRKILDRVKEGLKWQKDILRHTSISHFVSSSNV